jgi:hypothetical protein
MRERIVMDPASILFLISQVLIALVLPLAALALTLGKDRRATFWFAGGVFYSLYIVLISLRPFGFAIAYGLPSFIVFAYLALLIDLLRQELGHASGLRFIFPFAMLVAAIHLLLVQQGLTLNAMPAQMFQSISVAIGNAIISYYGLACARHHASRSMYLLSAAGLLIILANLVRIWDFFHCCNSIGKCRS